MGPPESYNTQDGPGFAASESINVQHGEPIAIVGIGCRLPGKSSDPCSLWELLKKPIDLSSPFPSSRFSSEGFYHEDAAHHGTTNSRGSYFLDDQDIQRFDAQFFNISPQEAEAMDPQHRLLLEVVYEALEDAGIPLSAVSGTATAAYVGLMTADWQDLQLRDMDGASRYLVTGGARSLASNRLSYFFNWHGPSETIDTACSSSLVAVHHGVQALRSGQATMVAAAGTNLLLAPDMYVMTSNLNMLSPTGKCHMWSSDADGYARGEGVACVMLKTLSKALADGDHVYAVVRETGVNQDGHTTGITMPSATAQARLIRETYKRAGLDLRRKEDRCQYFEAHGTGTPAGDPVEAQAIRDAFFPSAPEPGDCEVQMQSDHGEARMERVVVVGSVKTVLGHLEGCAGIAGLIKVALGLENSFIPGNLHLGIPSPKIRPLLDSGKLLVVPPEGIPWPPTGTCRRASVNSFGFGGTNAHAILESFHDARQQHQGQQEQQEAMPDAAQSPRSVTVVLSAASEPALAALTSKYADYLEANAHVDLARLAWTTQKRRTRLAYRVAFTGPSRAALVRQMRTSQRAFQDGGRIGSMALGSTSGGGQEQKQQQLLGIFTGQGAQWATMGTKLMDASPVFAESIARLEKVLSATMAGESDTPAWSLEAELRAPPGSSRIGEAEYAQPLSAAVQVALIDMLHSLGIEFSAVVGHSSGEMAAAYAAGFLTASDAIRLAYFRGKLCKLAHSPNVDTSPPPPPEQQQQQQQQQQQGATTMTDTDANTGANTNNTCTYQTPRGGGGGMMAANISWHEALELCTNKDLGFYGKVWVAANNAPKSVTLSGDLTQLGEIQKLLREKNMPSQMLRVDKAYHSPHMAAAADALRAVLARCHLDGPPPRPPPPGQRSLSKRPVWVSSVFTDWPPLRSHDESVPELAWSPQYWIENLLAPVRFHDALGKVAATLPKIEVGVEVGPHAALRRQVSDSWIAAGQGPIAYQGTLSRGCHDQESFAALLAFLWQHGVDLDFDAPYSGLAEHTTVGAARPVRHVALTALPRMPWTHSRVYWSESGRLAQLIRRGPADDLIGHCLERGIAHGGDGNSSARRDTKLGEWRWRQILRLSELPWLQGHKVQGQVVFPAAGYCVMAMQAAEQLVKGLSPGGSARQGTRTSTADAAAETLVLDLVELRDVEIGRALVFSDNNREGIDILIRLYDMNVINKHDSQVTQVTQAITQVTNPASSAPGIMACCSSTLEACFSIQAQMPAVREPGRPNEPFLVCSGRLVGAVQSSISPISKAMPPYVLDPVYMQAISPSTLYASYAEAGLEYTDPFRVESLERVFGRARAVLGPAQQSRESTSCFPVAALDTAFQTALAAFSSPGDGRLLSPCLPKTIRRLRMHLAAYRTMAKLPGCRLLFDATTKGRAESQGSLSDTPPSSWNASVEGVLFRPDESSVGRNNNNNSSSSSSSNGTGTGTGNHRMIFQVEDLCCVNLDSTQGPYKEGIFSEEVWVPDPDCALADFELEPDGPNDSANMQIVEELAHYYMCQVYQAFSKEEAESPKTQWFIKRLWQWLDHVIVGGGGSSSSQGSPSGTTPIRPFCNPWANDTEERIKRLMARVEHSMKNLVEIQILQAVAHNMLRVMRQEEGPTILEVLFKDDMLGRLYREPAVYARVNGYLGRVARTISRRFPRCNIIEVGAGTGGATQAMFSGLQGAYNSYTFTDISSGFFKQATAKFAGEADRMIFKMLDVEKDALAQGFSAAAYDIVVAANVLHATKDIGRSLTNIRKLLKPGGYLLLIEVTALDKVLVPFLMGAVPGWWLFEDKWRAETFSPLLPRARWDQALRESGFDTGAEHVFPDMSRLDDHLSSVLVARATDPSWLGFKRCIASPSAQFHTNSIIMVAASTNKAAQLPTISGLVALNLLDALTGLSRAVVNTSGTETELAALGSPHHIITMAESLEEAAASPSFDRSMLVVLSDLDHPILDGITPATWEALKLTFGRASRPIVWATRGRVVGAIDARQSMIVGMGRCARSENPALKLQFVDLSLGLAEDRSLPGPAAIRSLAQHIWQANFKVPKIEVPQTDGGAFAKPKAAWLVGSLEHEVAINKDGHLMFPRLVRLDMANQRYLAGRRGLVHDEDERIENNLSKPPSQQNIPHVLHHPSPPSSSPPSPPWSECERCSPGPRQRLDQLARLHLSYPNALPLRGIDKPPCYVSILRMPKTQHATLVLSSRLPYQQQQQQVNTSLPSNTDSLLVPLSTANLVDRDPASSCDDATFLSVFTTLLAAELVFQGFQGFQGYGQLQATSHAAVMVLEPSKPFEIALASLAHKYKRRLYVITTRDACHTLGSAFDTTYLHPNTLPHRASRLLARHRQGLYLDWPGFQDTATREMTAGDQEEILSFPLPNGFRKISEADFLTPAIGNSWRDSSSSSSIFPIPIPMPMPIPMSASEQESLSTQVRNTENLTVTLLKMAEAEVPLRHLRQTDLIDWSAERTPNLPLRRRLLPNPQHLIHSVGTYLLAGITSDLGLAMAKWLVQNGARKVALASRSPALPQLWLDEMGELGATTVSAFAMDVTDSQSVQKVCSDIEMSMGPVVGVVFGAMVLRDALFESMPFETLQSVLAPKVQGSRYVEAYFADRPLDFFIFMSSTSAIVGVRGQSNYCAGNMYGRALVASRRLRGLAASSMDLSTVFGVGHFANAGRETLDTVRANLRGFNTLPVGVPEVLAAFHEAILRGHPSASATGDVIVGLGSEEAVAGRLPPVPATWHDDARFCHFTARAAQNSAPGLPLLPFLPPSHQGSLLSARDGSRHVRKKLAAKTTDEDRLATLSECFSSAIAETMQLAELPRCDAPLIDHGIDSLVAVDLRAWLTRELEVSVPVLSILNGGSILELCKLVLSQVDIN